MFYTPEHCWQFQLISLGESVFGEQKIYHTSEAARKGVLEGKQIEALAKKLQRAPIVADYGSQLEEYALLVQYHAQVR